MLFHYTIVFYDEDDIYDERRDEHGCITDKGLVAANDYGTAADRVTDYVGKENVVSIELYECMNPMSYEEFEDIVKEN